MFTKVKVLDCPYARSAAPECPMLVELVASPPARGKYIYWAGGWQVARTQSGKPYRLGFYGSLFQALFHAK
jgi:hypothetical protein